MNSQELSKRIAGLVIEKKGTDVLIMDIQHLTTISDYFVVCTADSDVQVRAIKNHILDELFKESIKPWHVEGSSSRNWLLVDFVNVVVHIFQAEARSHFALERLWGDAKITEIKDKDETSGIHQE